MKYTWVNTAQVLRYSDFHLQTVSVAADPNNQSFGREHFQWYVNASVLVVWATAYQNVVISFLAADFSLDMYLSHTFPLNLVRYRNRWKSADLFIGNFCKGDERA